MNEKVFLGIDVSKGYADFIILDSKNKEREAVFQLDDTSKGHVQLSKILYSFLEKNPQTEICCGVESTGGYERNWYRYLLSLSETKPIKVALLNPSAVKGVDKALLRRTVTDGVSAENIAIYLKNYPEKVVYGKLEQERVLLKEGRSHQTYIKMLIKQKVQLVNQLDKVLYQYFSEMLTYCRHGVPSWLLRVLIKYPTANHIIKAGVDKLVKEPGVSKEKAKSLIMKAMQNTQNAGEHIGFIIQNSCSEILHKEEMIESNKKYLRSFFKNDFFVQLLMSIKGVGINSAIMILLEIEDISRFESSKKLASYFGLNPVYRQSGDGTYGMHLSKKGRSLIRATLYMVCLSAIRSSELFKNRYASLRAIGRKHQDAMGILMHKMLRIIYGMLKNETQYSPEIDRKNQEKSSKIQEDKQEQKKKQVKEEMKKKRRYQKQDLKESPISKRMVKKVKDLEQPQTVNTVDTGSCQAL